MKIHTKIRSGDLVAVYLWDGGAHAFHNAQHVESIELGETVDAFVSRWLTSARLGGASFRFDTFTLEERAFRENNLDYARGDLTAAILNDETTEDEFAVFCAATHNAYGVPS